MPRIPHCGAKYLVNLSNHLTDVHRLDYIQRRKWLQEAKLQPKIRVVIYPAKASQEFRMRSKSKKTLLKQQEGKDTVLYQISTPRKVNKTLKSLTRGIGKAAKNIQHYNRAEGLCNYFQHKCFNQRQLSVYNTVLYSLTATIIGSLRESDRLRGRGEVDIKPMVGQKRRQTLSNPASTNIY